MSDGGAHELSYRPREAVSAPQAAVWYRWYVLIVLLLIYAFNYVDRQIVTILAPGMRLPVHLSVGPARRTAAQGERWGTVTMSGATLARAPAVAAASLGEPSLGWRLKHLP